MRKDRAVFDFVKFSIPHKVEFGRNVIEKMTDNANFPNPDVSLTEIAAVTTQLESRSLAAQGGGREATVLLHQTEDDWNDLLRKMCGYVDRIADGDGAVILSAGFNLAKQPAPAVRPEFSVELGDRPGSVELRRQAVEGAKSYIWQHCQGDSPAPDHEWVTAQVTSRASVQIDGLIPMNKYWFRVAAVTTSGTSPYLQPLMQVVL